MKYIKKFNEDINTDGFIDVKSINSWFDKLSYELQSDLTSKYLKHRNVDMLSDKDIITIYLNEN